ncbi:hypothetical protein CALCODRAFT_496302 [Calocera cornea HHB12733]|uniref:DUF6533 domain-containing protein n=1 Tax=Calocera cornea HHB12733 TaxID=1353952 RepID=A0A165FXI0_9BASI|nr:hypothetical protein CALCODRAFT_496302 [Calocera cornea HHB12733]
MDLESELAEAVQYDTLITQAIVASLAFVVYDYTLTFRAEVQFVWLVKWTPGKVLFLVVRYLPFVYFPLLLNEMLMQTPSEAVCKGTLYAAQYLIVAQAILSETVIALRTWVLWEKRRSVGILLIMCWCEAIVVATFYDHWALSVDTYVSYPAGFGLGGCAWIADATGGPLGNIYIAWAVSETINLSLTLIRGMMHWRNQSFANLLTVLYRDAFLVSLVYSTIAITAIALIHTGQGMWANAFTMFYAASKAVLPGRIILNIREAAMSLDKWDIPTVAQSPPMRMPNYHARGSSDDTAV